MDQQNQLQESNLSEPDVLSNCTTTNDVLADLKHKLKIETESEMPKNRHGLKQSIKILGNGDNALYRLGDKTYLLERIEFWKNVAQKLMEFYCWLVFLKTLRVLLKKILRLNYITEDKWSVWYVRSFWHAIQIMIVRGDTKRETNLKNEMKIVRRMIWLACFAPAESQPV